MNKVIIRQLRIHANHGVMEQERTVGADFTIDLEIGTDFSKAIETDNVADTINYARVHEIVKEEMAKPSRLLEHVAGRIVAALFREFAEAETVSLRLIKTNPPLGADCDGMGVEITENRK